MRQNTLKVESVTRKINAHDETLIHPTDIEDTITKHLCTKWWRNKDNDIIN